MKPPPAPEKGALLEAFGRRHLTGLVTLLFTDLVGSTQMKQALGEREAVNLIQRQRAVVRDLLQKFPDAEEIETAGDSFLLVFAKPSAAVKFALQLQAGLHDLSDQSPHPVQSRMGIHVGEVFVEEHATGGKAKDLYGLQVDICGRVMSLAAADQILMSRFAFDNARSVLRGEEIAGVGALRWLNHGPYLLKGVEEPIEICEVRAGVEGPVTPPTSSEKAQRYVSPDAEPVLGWRPAVEQAVPGTEWVLEEKLGEGGFGEVWLGQHRKLKERRVFKFCFRADRARALKRELTLFRLLKERVGEHPNIVRLLEVYFEEPPYYLEMEYVAGKDLKTWCALTPALSHLMGEGVRRTGEGGVERIPLETRLEIVAQVADALQAAHESGVIHRDVKPGNILIAECGMRSAELGSLKSEIRNPKTERDPKSEARNSNPGSSRREEALEPSQAVGPKKSEPPHVGCYYGLRAKLTDFGIGQVVSEEALAGITRAGFTQTIMSGSSSSHTGTQLYMAPELLAGKPASTRSDIYSLGVVLYQLVAGDLTRPLTTDWADQIDDPLLRDDLKHCFAGNPQDRFGSAAQLAKQLRTLPERRAELERQQAEKAALERAAYRRGIVRAASMAAALLLIFAALSIYALRQSRLAKAETARAQQEWQRAEAKRADATRLLYFANINLAQQAWSENKPERVRQLLKEAGDYPDKGFEWFYWQRMLRLNLLSLRGHLDNVLATAYSPDGTRIVTGSADQTAKIWEAATGLELLTLHGHNSGVHSVAFSPDNARILTGSYDKTCKIWDVATGRELRSFERGERYASAGGVSSAGFSPDGKRIVADCGPMAKVWDAFTGQELFRLEGHTNGILFAGFSPDGRRIATTGQGDNLAKLWDAQSGRELMTLRGHYYLVFSVAFSPDGGKIATGSGDGTARIWDAATGQEIVTLKGQSGNSAFVFCVLFSLDGQRLITSSRDSTISFWDLSTGAELSSINAHNASVLTLAMSPDGSRLASGGDSLAKVWENSTGIEVKTLRGHGDQVVSAAISADGSRVVTGSADRTAKMWNGDTGEELLTLAHDGAVEGTAFSTDDQWIATASMEGMERMWHRQLEGGAGTARIWDAQTGKEKLKLRVPAGLAAVQFSPDGKHLAAGGVEPVVRIWEIATGQERLTLKGHKGRISEVAYSPDGRRLLSARYDGTSLVWDALTGQKLGEFTGQAAAFSPDGRMVITGGGSGTVRVWNADTGKPFLTFQGHRFWTASAAFSPDGRRLLTGGGDNFAQIWDAQSGRELLSLTGHREAIFAAGFSRDGRRIVTASKDFTAKIWQAASPEEVKTWEEQEKQAELLLSTRRSEREGARAVHVAKPGTTKK